MNKCFLIGRITRDPDIRSMAGDTPTTIARWNLAVDRRGKDAGADFISCVAFGKTAEFAEKYLRKGVKIAVIGRIQTGSYTNKDGQKVYTTDVIVEECEFCESKNANNADGAQPTEQERPVKSGEIDWQTIPDNITEDKLPFGG